MRVRATVPAIETRELQQLGQRSLRVVARLGYLTHGVVYGLMGTLALLSVLGRGERVTDSHGAVHRIGAESQSEALLWAVAVGLACYALWNLVRALLDPERTGRDGEGLLKRLGYGVSAISHALLATYTFQLAAGAAGAGHSQKHTVAAVLNLPAGRICIGIAGLAVIIYGLSELWRAIRGDVAREYAGSELPPRRRRLVVRLARLGHAARGVVFPIVGVSLIMAALKARASEADSFGDALRELASQPFGHVALGLVAVGLIAYGIHMLCVARYARIPQPG